MQEFTKLLQDLASLKEDFAELKTLVQALAPEPPKNRLFDIKEASEFLKLSKARIYALVNERKIPYAKSGGKLYFMENELIDWLKSGRNMERSK